MKSPLDHRAAALFRELVESYLETGEPVGSRTLARFSSLGLSPASIRNILADLETEGLLFAPHVSAGRLPTQRGLRLYVDGMMEVGNLAPDEQSRIMAECRAGGRNATELLNKASGLLSGLAAGVGFVIAPKSERKTIKQIQLVRLDAGRALVVLVGDDGIPENRLIAIDPTLPDSAFEQANNYLHAQVAGHTLADARAALDRARQSDRRALDMLTAQLIQSGIAEDTAPDSGMIFVRGQSRLLEDVRALTDLERARNLLARLEEQSTMLSLLDAVQNGEGVQIFIGTEHRMFSSTGWSLVISPYRTAEQRLIGAVGVIGPSRVNYGRIVPIVDFTSQVISHLLTDQPPPSPLAKDRIVS